MNSPSFQYICKKCTTIEQPLPTITNTNIISPKESTGITILMTDINSQLKSHDKILFNIIKQLNTTNSNIINKLTELTKLTSYTSSQFDKHYTQLNNTPDLSSNINIPRQSVTTSPQILTFPHPVTKNKAITFTIILPNIFQVIPDTQYFAHHQQNYISTCLIKPQPNLSSAVTHHSPPHRNQFLRHQIPL